ncbi:MAG: hypothetical protein KAG66_10275 [Methylococcales bacterium]|nr:hypothetical protein [Methylococcales bacterium]
MIHRRRYQTLTRFVDNIIQCARVIGIAVVLVVSAVILNFTLPNQQRENEKPVSQATSPEHTQDL